MKHVRQVVLNNEDMKRVLDLLGIEFIKDIINESGYKERYPKEIKEEHALYFLNNNLDSTLKKTTLKKFYKKLNDKLEQINLKFLNVNKNYDRILYGKNLIQLRSLFEKSKLDISEINATSILLKCLDLEYTKSIAFTIDNELYIRSRIEKEKNENEDKSKEYINKINKLMLELKEYELNIGEKDKKIDELEKIIKSLEYYDPDIGYYSELTQIDYVNIIESLGKHSSQIKDKFKKLIQEFEENENKPQYKLYEMWMEWTDDEVTILDSILKKSMYEEVIKRSDIDDLEYISENIMNRYLLSRLLLHLIYRRMSSQYLEEVLV